MTEWFGNSLVFAVVDSVNSDLGRIWTMYQLTILMSWNAMGAIYNFIGGCTFQVSDWLLVFHCYNGKHVQEKDHWSLSN